jgi:hypothetical protein
MHIDYIIYVKYAGFEVLTAVVMKSTTFCDIPVLSVEKVLMFQKNTSSPPSSRLKNKPSKNPPA